MTDKKRVTPDEARALGAHLAKFERAAQDKLRTYGVEPSPLCASCAFREGTFPNAKAPATGMDALKCLIENVPFGCHHDKGPDGLPTRMCGGFTNIMRAYPPGLSETVPGLPPQAPWPFSDEVETTEAQS